MLYIALPNKGSLSDDSVQLVKEAGYNCRRYGRELVVRDSDNDIEFIFLRPRDIAVYVSNGVLDLGITGRDLALDSEVEVRELLSLGFGKSTFCYALPSEQNKTPDDFNGLRIATSYASLTRADLAKRGVNAKIVKLDGAVEISIKLGVADAIADVVQTGRTLVEAGLKITGEPILKSEAVLVSGKPEIENDERVRRFIERLKGIILARAYIMVEYDVEEKNLQKACELTPGIESPTVAPLSKKGWVAVKAMARRKEVNLIMDRLTDIGARGIIITDIRTCRI